MRQIRETRAQHRAQDERGGEDAYAFADGAHTKEEGCREVLGLGAESSFEQFVSRQEIAAKVSGDEEQTDDEARDDIAEDDLQVAEVTARRESYRWNTDERDRASLGRNDGKTDDDPRSILIAEEIIFDGALRTPEERAEDRDAHEIEQQDAVIYRRESHYGCASIVSYRARSLILEDDSLYFLYSIKSHRLPYKSSKTATIP